ncbi:MAG: ABC transporter permease [Clostridiales bacterium]|nr:ABC transporter permease [Clostridiales bacterium]
MKNKINRAMIREILPVAGLVFVIVLFAILTKGQIVNPTNLKLLLSQTYMLAIACMGVFFVMSMGCLDFSQGSLMGVTCIVVCYLSNINLFLAIIGGIVAGGLLGAVNGYFHVVRKIPSFIVTNCMMYALRGVVAYLTTKSPVYAVSSISNLNTMPFMLTITLVVLAIGFFIYKFTCLGANLKAIGAGEKAARFAGIKVEKTKFLVYVAAGCITGFAAFINAIKVGSVTSTGGNQLETQILIALVLGGMPISGGAKSRFTNIIVGVLLYKFLSTGLVMLGFTTAMQQLIQGIVFLIVVFLFSDRESIQVIK